MTRLSYIERGEADPRLRPIYDAVEAYGPFANQIRTMAHCPPVLEHIMALLFALREAANVSRRHIELLNVTVAKRNQCSYCVAHHAPRLEVEGMSEEGIDLLPAYEDHPELDEVDRLVVQYAILVNDDPIRITDRFFARLRACFSEAAIAELTWRIGLAGAFNRINHALDIDIESDLVQVAAANIETVVISEHFRRFRTGPASPIDDRRWSRTKMIFGVRALAALMLLIVAMTPSSSKADTFEPIDLYLVMFMGGVTAGSVKLSIDPKDDRIDSRLRMKSQGLFKFMTGYKSSAEGKSTHGIDGQDPMPVSYTSSYETNKNERKVQISYDAGDGQITDLKAWKRGEPRKSKVPKTLRQETIDPLTAVLQLRRWIRDIRAGRSGDVGKKASADRRFEIFDGRRRYQLHAELLERRKMTFDGEKRPVFRFKVQLAPIAGFSSKDMLANWASEDGKRWIELVVTDDDNPLPVFMKTQGGTLQTTIYLRKVCLADAGCNKIKS